MKAGPRATLAACTAAVLVSGLLLAAPMVASSPSPRVAEAMAPSDLARSDPRSVSGAPVRTSADPMMSNDEVVVATLAPSGLPDEVTLISRILTVDYPEQDIADPASVTNVKYLDRLGRPQTSGSDVLLTVGGEGQNSVLTQARFDKPLPVALHAQYTLNGQVVAPDSVAGAAGDLRIDYTLTNTTAQEQMLRYTDAAGSRQTSKRPVFAPFSGTASVTVPRNVEVQSAPGAIRYTDQAGKTVLNWNVSLFPPITSNQQSLVVHTYAQRAAIPEVAVRLFPVTSAKDPALDFTAEALDASVEGNATLYQGMVELDDNAATLAEGAGELAAGLQSLASGSGEVSGAADQVADGLGALDAGADQVASGTAQLAAALREAASGAGKLASATRQLADADNSSASDALTSLIGGARDLTAGATALATRFGSASDPPLPDPLPAPDSDTECAALPPSATPNPAELGSSALTASASVGADAGTPAGIPPLSSGSPTSSASPPASASSTASAEPPPTNSSPPYDDDCVTLYQGVRSLVAGLSQIAGLSQLINAEIANSNNAAAAIRSGLTGVATETATAASGAASLVAQLCGPVATLPPATCAQLAAVAASAGRAAQGSAALADPLTSLLTSLGKLSAMGAILSQSTAASVQAGSALLAGMDGISAGLGSLGSGAGAGSSGLVSGLSDLTAGLVKFSDALATSSAQLSLALKQLAMGTSELAGGIGAAADGASELVTGSQALAQGTERAEGGAQQLAAGISELAAGTRRTTAGATELAVGAAQLQAKGTASVVDSVLTNSTAPALAQAWLAAAGARAADALPYGAPKGATGHVAYLMTIPGADPPAPSLWNRMRQWLGG